jgi:hypothetical protein
MSIPRASIFEIAANDITVSRGVSIGAGITLQDMTESVPTADIRDHDTMEGILNTS